jgi:hypothetical protein
LHGVSYRHGYIGKLWAVLGKLSYRMETRICKLCKYAFVVPDSHTSQHKLLGATNSFGNCMLAHGAKMY